MQLCFQSVSAVGLVGNQLMAITIRNKETEAMIRRIGRRWDMGPSEVVARLATEELARAGSVSPAEFERRMKAWDELMAMVPKLTDEQKRDMQYEMDHMFDYLDQEPTDESKQAAE
jgi:hypothetical protein